MAKVSTKGRGKDSFKKKSADFKKKTASKAKKTVSKKTKNVKVSKPKVAKKTKVAAKEKKPKTLSLKEVENESLTPEQLKIKGEEEELKKYIKCLRFCKKYKKNVLNPKKRNQLSEVERLIADLDGLCPVKSRYRGLIDSKKKRDKLDAAVEPLRVRSEQKLKDILEKVPQLSEEDQKIFWTAHERNRGVTSFLDLVTKKDYETQKQSQHNVEMTEAGEKDISLGGLGNVHVFSGQDGNVQDNHIVVETAGATIDIQTGNGESFQGSEPTSVEPKEVEVQSDERQTGDDQPMEESQV